MKRDGKNVVGDGLMIWFRRSELVGRDWKQVESRYIMKQRRSGGAAQSAGRSEPLIYRRRLMIRAWLQQDRTEDYCRKRLRHMQGTEHGTQAQLARGLITEDEPTRPIEGAWFPTSSIGQAGII